MVFKRIQPEEQPKDEPIEGDFEEEPTEERWLPEDEITTDNPKPLPDEDIDWPEF